MQISSSILYFCSCFTTTKIKIVEFISETFSFRKEIVHQNGNSLRYVKKQTEDICKLAVRQNGDALKYVKELTEDICKIAVFENGYALKYVINQTEYIRNLANRKKIYVN